MTERAKAIADVLTTNDEVIDDSKPYEIFDPEFTWKRKTVTDFYAKSSWSSCLKSRMHKESPARQNQGLLPRAVNTLGKRSPF